jgi:hypothetical protein
MASAPKRRTAADHPTPHPLLTLTEAQRLMVEASSYIPLRRWLQRLPKGDGHPVWVLPGFTASDVSTVALRRFLKRQGYRPLPWEFGRNMGPRGDLEHRMRERLHAISDHHEEPVTLIGQSLGGVYARELARETPAAVRQVITLGSPFASVQARGTNPAIARLFELATGKRSTPLQTESFFRRMAEPTGVPTTAVYSRFDGVVHWRTCIEKDDPSTDNIEVHGSHCGMAINPQVLYVIGDRLAQPQGSWRKFERTGMRRIIYPMAPSNPSDAALQAALGTP